MPLAPTYRVLMMAMMMMNHQPTDNLISFIKEISSTNHRSRQAKVKGNPFKALKPHRPRTITFLQKLVNAL